MHFRAVRHPQPGEGRVGSLYLAEPASHLFALKIASKLFKPNLSRKIIPNDQIHSNLQNSINSLQNTSHFIMSVVKLKAKLKWATDLKRFAGLWSIFNINYRYLSTLFKVEETTALQNLPFSWPLSVNILIIMLFHLIGSK